MNRLAATIATAALALLALAPAASASKQAVDFFGGSGALGGQFSDPAGVAVNDSGAGPANAGDVYAIDSRCCQPPAGSANRIQRFGRDDNGTPGNTPAATADDTYFFISAWGADVVQTGGSGDLGDAAAANYEICTVAAECQAAAPSGGNGTAAGNGALNFNDIGAGALAIDQDTGNLFVSDLGNNRVNVYDGVGAFLHSFGFDVVASGPGDRGSGFEVCVAADGDVCKRGVGGAGVGQIGTGEGIAVSVSDANPTSGTVYLADSANNRVNTYDLDGSGPGSIGSAAVFDKGTDPAGVAIDSRGILYVGANANNSEVERYDTAAVNGPVGFLAPIPVGVNEVQRLTVAATAGTFNLSFDPDGAGPLPPETTPDLPFNATGSAVRGALQALPSIGSSGIGANGGPGDATGSSPYTITFQDALSAKDVSQIVAADGATPLSGGAGASVATTTPGQPGLKTNGLQTSLAVDPDSDGGGADTDVLYVERNNFSPGAIQQFGPLNAPGLLAAPTNEDDRHGTNGVIDSTGGIAVEPSTGRLYAAANGSAGRGVYVIDETGPPPTASMDSVDNVTTDSADLHATIDPNGPPLLSYRFEHSDDGGSTWTPTPTVVLGIQTDPQDIDTTLEPAPIGLSPNADYLVRLVATRRFATPIVTAALPFRTDPSPPLAETAGAPVRSTTSAQLNGRLVPRNSATTYRFEYGEGGPCGSNPCASTPNLAAGSDDLTKLAAAEIRGLTPDTTYHYRLIAEGGVGGEVSGGDMTVRTRASDTLPGQSDAFPGPPGSDRAWEMVSMADPSGNPISLFATDAFSDDGNRAIYGIAGGTPIGPTASFSSLYLSQRTERGWQPSLVFPSREEMIESGWTDLHAADDLSSLVSVNFRDGGGGRGLQAWRLHPAAAPALLFEQRSEGDLALAASADGSRVLAHLGGALDPAYPAATGQNVYDISTGSPQLASLLPGNLIGPCGSLPPGVDEANPVSEDGALAFFEASPAPPCARAPAQLYLRDFAAAQTRLISGPPLSGPDCGGSLIKSIPGAVFFATCSRLDPDDGGGNDVYRYQVSDGSLQCVTCVIAGFDVGVQGDDTVDIAVADDGSRLYFTSAKRLLPDGQSGVYRLEVASGDLAYVAPIAAGIGTASNSAEIDAGGGTFVFASDADFFNPLGGVSDNDGLRQYYRYDDEDRSLVCVSCPQDGGTPFDEVSGTVHRAPRASGNSGHNQRSLSADGKTFAFAGPTPLVGADQNTPGPGGSATSGVDAYEWRDGRLLLLTDGITTWSSPPLVEGISPSGADVFFSAPAAYTPDAPDALVRLYTARIGGGIEFPPPGLPPCDLNSGACEGAASAVPDLPGAGSAVFEGQGDPQDPFPRDCSAASARAAKLTRLARALRKSARRAADPKRAKALRRKAAKASRKAKKARRGAKRCRGANNRRAER